MSEKLNVSQPVYSRYENDEKQPKDNDEFVKRVAEEFGVPYGWLLKEDGNNPNFEIYTGIHENTLSVSGNYYTLPKDFMDSYFKQQQQMLEMILNVLERVKS